MRNRVNRKSEVRELQNMLRVIAKTNGSLPLVNPDGIFGAKTEEAVIAFQREEGLDTSGIVDRETWDAIFRAYTDALRIRDLRPIQPFPSGNYEISRGERSDIVLIIQILFSALAIALDVFEDVALTGEYDQNTEEAVEALQALQGLSPSGTFDAETWNALAQLYQHVFGNALYGA